MSFTYPTVTLAGRDYPVLASLDAADEYLDAEPNADAWRAGEDDERKRWLISASRTFGRQQWTGTPTESGQAYPFPRTGIDGIDPAAIPTQIEEGVIELAAAIAGGYDAANQQSTANTIKRQKAGSVEQEFFAPADGLRFPLPVWELIALLLVSGSSGIGGAIASGTCGRSIVESDCDYRPYEGRSARDCC